MDAAAAAPQAMMAMDVALEERAAPEPAMAQGAVRGERYLARAASAAKSAAPRGAAGSGTAPTVTLKPWDPKTPYIDALKSADKGEAYKVYLKEREKHADSPAFYIDCAGWFY